MAEMPTHEREGMQPSAVKDPLHDDKGSGASKEGKPPDHCRDLEQFPDDCGGRGAQPWASASAAPPTGDAILAPGAAATDELPALSQRPALSTAAPGNEERVLLWIEKVAGKGEDAEPLYLKGQGGIAIAVFDGMGGSGSMTVNTTEGESHTGAWIASREACQVCAEVFCPIVKAAPAGTMLPLESGSNDTGREPDPQRRPPGSLADHLRERLTEAFRKLNAGSRGSLPPSGLRSAIIRRFPTTLAALVFDAREPDCVTAIWAGDSRCYLLMPHDGLKQLSKDHTKVDVDPFVALTEDPPLAKYVSERGQVDLEQRCFAFSQPAALIVATDGAFSYLPTPMHFEAILLETLVKAWSFGEWERQLGQKLASVAADDVSLVIAPVGWASFDEIKRDLHGRIEELKRSYLDEISALEQNIRSLRQKLQADEAAIKMKRQAAWDRYKSNYMRYLG